MILLDRAQRTDHYAYINFGLETNMYFPGMIKDDAII